jgi:hypothetical protein
MVTSGMLAAVTTEVSGSPLPSQARWSLDPGLPRSTGFAPTWSPAFGAHAGRVHARARPVQPARQTKPVQHLQMELLEHSGLGPLVQPAPRRRRQATAELHGRQQAPRGRGTGHVDDRSEAVPIRDGAHPAAPPGTRRRWQQGLDDLPQVVRNELVYEGRHGARSCQSYPKGAKRRLSECCETGLWGLAGLVLLVLLGEPAGGLLFNRPVGLVVLPGQPGGHQPDHGDLDHRLGVLGFAFVVAGQPP